MFPSITSNDSRNADLFYQDKLKYFMLRLKSAYLGPQEFFFGYEMCWLPSLSFESLVLTIPHSIAILALLHKALLSKLKMMGTFPLFMRSAATEIGGLNLSSL